MRELDAAPLASIVLFTDGADNRSKNLATVLGKTAKPQDRRERLRGRQPGD